MIRFIVTVLIFSSVCLADTHSDWAAELAEAQAVSTSQPLLALAGARALATKIDRVKEPQLFMQTQALLSNSLANLSRYPEALQAAEDGLALSKTTPEVSRFTEEIFQLRQALATASLFLGNTPGASEILNELEKEALSQKRNDLLSGVYIQQGLLYSTSGRHLDALQVLEKAWNDNIKPGADGNGDLFHLIANAYSSVGETDRAIALHKAAITEMQQQHLVQRLSLVGYAIGNIEMKRESYGEAANWFTEARNWAHEANDPIGEAFNSLQIATALIKKKDFSNATKWLDACEKTFVQNGFIPQQALLELARAEISLAQNHAQRALGNIITAETRFSARDLPPPIKFRLLKLKIEALKALGRDEQASEAETKLGELPGDAQTAVAPLSEQDKTRLQATAAAIDQHLARYQKERESFSATSPSTPALSTTNIALIATGMLIVLTLMILAWRRRGKKK